MWHNKKAAIGETITWVVATIIIIVILAFSIFVTGIIAKGKAISKDVVVGKTDLLASKSLTAYLLTTDSSGENIFDQLNDRSDLFEDWELFDEFSGDLAEDIFLKLYKKSYREDKIWLGIYYDIAGGGARRNKYFVTSPPDIKGGDQNWRIVNAPYVLEQINLDKEKFFVLLMTN